jgi:hypothetical protein
LDVLSILGFPNRLLSETIVLSKVTFASA